MVTATPSSLLIRSYVRQDPRFLRPAEVDLLIGDPSKATRELGWKTEVDFEGLARFNRFPNGGNTPGLGVSPLYGGAFYWRVLTRF